MSSLEEMFTKKYDESERIFLRQKFSLMIYCRPKTTNFHSYHLQRFFTFWPSLRTCEWVRETQYRKTTLIILALSFLPFLDAFILNTCMAKKCCFFVIYSRSHFTSHFTAFSCDVSMFFFLGFYFTLDRNKKNFLKK